MNRQPAGPAADIEHTREDMHCFLLTTSCYPTISDNVKKNLIFLIASAMSF